MATIHLLLPGRCYRVVRAFTDYDHLSHPVGETWEFVGTNFLPYEDGLTLHVLVQGQPLTYRLQWRAEEQAAIIENFIDFIAPCSPPPAP